MSEVEGLTEEQEKKLEKALVNRIASNLTFTELIDIVTSLSVREVSQQLSEMSEEEKIQTYSEVFEESV
jgi:energy-converting hydrogenase A subunit M